MIASIAKCIFGWSVTWMAVLVNDSSWARVFAWALGTATGLVVCFNVIMDARKKWRDRNK
jgi:integral membrane sensor domain MASE1